MSVAGSEHNRFMSSDLNRPRLDENGVRDLKASNHMIGRLTDKLNGYLSQRQTAATTDDYSVARPSYMPLGSAYNQMSATSTGWGRLVNHSSGTEYLAGVERYGASRIAQLERKIQQAQADNLLMQRLARSDKELLLTNYATRLRHFNDKFAHRYFQDNYLQDVPRIPVRLGPVAGMPHGDQKINGHNPWDDRAPQTYNEGQHNKSGVRSMSQLYKSETRAKSRSKLDERSTKERKSAKSTQSSRSKSKSLLSRSLSKSKSKSKSAAKTLTLNRSNSRVKLAAARLRKASATAKSRKSDKSRKSAKSGKPLQKVLKRTNSLAQSQRPSRKQAPEIQTFGRHKVSQVADLPMRAEPRLIGKKKKERI